MLATTVRRLREEKGLTREATAFRAGITTGSLANVELAGACPSWETVRRIACALGLSIGQLAAAIEAAERTPQRIDGRQSSPLYVPESALSRPLSSRGLLTDAGEYG